MEGRLLLDIIIGKGSTVFELLSSEDEALLLWWDSFFILDLGFHVGNRVIWLDIQSDRLSGQRFDEDLHGSTAKAKDKMEGRFLLNIVIRESSAVLELLSSENQSLLLWWNSFFVLDLGFHIGNRVVGFDIQSDRLSREGLDEDLHGTTAKAQDKMEGRFLLDVVIREGSAILELLSGEDQSLLLRRNSFFVLDLGFHVGDRVIWLDVQSDGLSRKGLDEDLHGTTSKAEDKMEGRFLLDVVVRKGSAILELLSSEDQSLLLRRNSFFVLDLCLDIRDRVIWLDVQSDRLSREGLDEDLHGSTSKTKDKMEGRLLLNVVVRECSAVFKLLSSEDETLLLWRNAFFVLNLCLDIRDCVIGLHIKCDGFPRKGFYKNLHRHGVLYKV